SFYGLDVDLQRPSRLRPVEVAVPLDRRDPVRSEVFLEADLLLFTALHLLAKAEQIDVIQAKPPLVLRNEGERGTIDDIRLQIAAPGDAAHELRLACAETARDSNALAAPQQATERRSEP